MKLKEIHRDQPLAIMKQVWNVDEHFGQKSDSWTNSNIKGIGYKWSSGVFTGQSEGYNEHILKGMK